MSGDLRIDWEDAKKWIISLAHDDFALQSPMHKFLAVAAFRAGAEAQLLRLFPHLAAGKEKRHDH